MEKKGKQFFRGYNEKNSAIFFLLYPPNLGENFSKSIRKSDLFSPLFRSLPSFSIDILASKQRKMACFPLHYSPFNFTLCID